MSSFRVKDHLFSHIYFYFFAKFTEVGFVVVGKLWPYRANLMLSGCRNSLIWKLMFNVFLLDDALEDLKSQKKKIVSKTERKNSCCGPLKCFLSLQAQLDEDNRWKAETGRGGGEAISVALFSRLF